MAKTIKIEDDTYQKLKKLAVALNEDISAVVEKLVVLEGGLRNIKLDFNERPKRLSGKKLNILWDVFAEQAYYHRDGLWYMTLEQFPGAYFDPTGYVLFKTKKDYQNCPYLKIGPTTNLEIPLTEFPSYVKMN